MFTNTQAFDGTSPVKITQTGTLDSTLVPQRPLFTQEEIDALYAPFEAKEHKVREGSTKNKTQWLVYVDRPVIQRRLDRLFPGEWSFEILSITPTHTPDANGQSVSTYWTATVRLAIRGLVREFNGGNSNQEEDDGEKSAVTDAFKRVCSLWGIGLYLYEAPQIWTNGDYIDKNTKRISDYKKRDEEHAQAMEKVKQWLAREYGKFDSHPGGKPQQLSSPEPRKVDTSAIDTSGHWTADADKWTKYVTWLKNGGMTPESAQGLVGRAARDFDDPKEACEAVTAALAARNHTDIQEAPETTQEPPVQAGNEYVAEKVKIVESKDGKSHTVWLISEDGKIEASVFSIEKTAQLLGGGDWDAKLRAVWDNRPEGKKAVVEELFALTSDMVTVQWEQKGEWKNVIALTATPVPF